MPTYSNWSRDLDVPTPDMVALVRRDSRGMPLIQHYGVAFHFPGAGWAVYDLTPDEGLTGNWLSDWVGESRSWLARPTSDPRRVRAAWARLHLVFRSPSRDRYRLYDRNCEHLARWVATGRPESRQVDHAIVVGAVAALTACLLRSPAR